MARLPSVSAIVPSSARGRVLLRVCVFAIAVAQERRSVAKGSSGRVRRVDARTGAVPSLRQTVVVLGVYLAPLVLHAEVREEQPDLVTVAGYPGVVEQQGRHSIYRLSTGPVILPWLVPPAC
jgi:hypothetical protein